MKITDVTCKEALRVVRRLEKYDIFFVETPLPSDDLEG